MLETLGIVAPSPPPATEQPLADAGASSSSPAPAPPPVRADRPKPAPKPKAPPKPPGHWADVAGSLGLDVPPQQPKPPQSSPPPPRAAHAATETVGPSAVEPEETLDRLFSEKPRDLDVFSLSETGTTRYSERTARDRIDEDDETPRPSGKAPESDLIGDEPSPTRSSREAEREGRQPRADRDEGRGRGRRRGRGRGRGGRDREGARDAGRGESYRSDVSRGDVGREDVDSDEALRRPASYSPPEYEEEIEIDEDLAPPSPVNIDDEEPDELGYQDQSRRPAAADREREEGPRRRRGRRGGRGRDREDRGQPRSARSRPEVDDLRKPDFDEPLPSAAESDLRDELDDDDDEHTPGQPAHKKIPTWQEAVNVLIDANMASRASSPDRGHRGRGGRGRR